MQWILPIWLLLFPFALLSSAFSVFARSLARSLSRFRFFMHFLVCLSVCLHSSYKNISITNKLSAHSTAHTAINLFFPIFLFVFKLVHVAHRVNAVCVEHTSLTPSPSLRFYRISSYHFMLSIYYIICLRFTRAHNETGIILYVAIDWLCVCVVHGQSVWHISI